MQTFVIPGWIWINLILLVAAAIVVGVKLAVAEKTGRREPGKPVSSDIRRATK
jgi:hypothetical protein